MNNLAGMRCYLAGPIDRVENMGKDWRDDLSEFLIEKGVVVFNPLNKPINTGVENTENIAERKIWKQKGQYHLVQNHMKDVRSIDLALVDRADFLIVHCDLNIHMCGTYEELFWGNRCKKPIIVHMAQGQQNAPDWLFGTIPYEYMFDNWREVKCYLEFVDKVLVENLEKRWRVFNLSEPTLSAMLSLAKHNDKLKKMVLEFAKSL